MIASEQAAIRARRSLPARGRRPAPPGWARPLRSSRRGRTGSARRRTCSAGRGGRPHRPPSIRKPAKAIAYASTTHCRSGAENPRLDWIDGSATLTMLRSRMTMNCATQQTASSHAVPEPGLLCGRGGLGNSGPAVTSTLTRTGGPAAWRPRPATVTVLPGCSCRLFVLVHQPQIPFKVPVFCGVARWDWLASGRS